MVHEILQILQLDDEKRSHDPFNAEERTTYTSPRFVVEAIMSMSAVILKRVIAKIKEARWFAVGVDETTDVAIRSQMSVIVRFCNQLGEAEEVFLGVAGLRNGKSRTILSALLEMLEEKGLDIANLTSVGTDGASPMVGCKSGLATMLEEMIPHISRFHCALHRLALGAAAAAKDVPYLFQTFETVLLELYLYFHFSSSRKSRWKEHLQAVDAYVAPRVLVLCRFCVLLIVYRCMCDRLVCHVCLFTVFMDACSRSVLVGLERTGKITEMVKATFLRWLSHMGAVNAVSECNLALLSFFNGEEASLDAKAAGLGKLMRAYFYQATLRLFGDILPVLTQYVTDF